MKSLLKCMEEYDEFFWKYAEQTNFIDEIKKISSLDGVRLLILISCCIFAMKLIAKVGTVSDQFAQGAGATMGAEMGGLVVAAATNLGKKAVSSAGTVAGRGVRSAISGGSGASGSAQDTLNNLNNQWQANGGNNVLTPRQQPAASGGSGGANSALTSQQNSPSQNGNNIRNENGSVTLPNGDAVNGLGVAARNADGGVTFTVNGADGSKNIDSYDKDGNRTVQTFNKDGEMTSNFTQNKDGSSSGFIQRDDGTIDKWNDSAGTYKNVGPIQDRNDAKP